MAEMNEPQPEDRQQQAADGDQQHSQCASGRSSSAISDGRSRRRAASNAVPDEHDPGDE